MLRRHGSLHINYHVDLKFLLGFKYVGDGLSHVPPFMHILCYCMQYYSLRFMLCGTISVLIHSEKNDKFLYLETLYL